MRYQDDKRMAALIKQMTADIKRLERMEGRLIHLGARLGGVTPDVLLDRLEALVALLETIDPIEEPESLPELTFG